MGFLAIAWVLIALVLILIVLVQKGKGGGLSSAFGGAGGGAGLLGTKTGDFLTWVTITLVALFFLLAIILGKFYRPVGITYTDDETINTPTQTLPVDGVPAADPAIDPEAADTDAAATDSETPVVPVKTEDTPGETDKPVTE